MHIYFNASVSARSDYLPLYRSIVSTLEDLGYEVIADHILDYTIQQRAEETEESRKKYYYEMKKRIKSADLMVAEVSFPSTVHVGHELTLALEYNVPVLALFQKKKRPMLFWGIEEDKFLVEEYDEKTVKEVLESSIHYLMEQTDTRFNFFIGPKHQNYLDWISRHRKVPRAVFLRRLIEDAMANDEEYS